MAKYIKIGNDRFELIDVCFTPVVGYRSIHHAYANPSYAKQEIWLYWKVWFTENSESIHDFISITARTVQIFTVNGVITVNNERYAFRITKQKQLLYRLDSK